MFINPKLYVRDTYNSHQGRGVFASARIMKGEVIHVTAGRILTNAEYAELPKRYQGYCCDISDKTVLCPLDFENPTIDWFINHSCNPNIGSAGDFYTLVAMRDIEPGEEITMDYAMVDEDPDPRWNMDCYCGAPNCRKVITGNDWMLPELRERYRGYFQKNIQERIDAMKWFKAPSS